MQKAILFPSSVFSRFEVDESFQNEYNAVRANGDFRIVLYDYEAFVRTGEVLLALCPDEDAIVIYRGWMFTPEQYGAFFRELESRGLHLVTTPEQYAALHLFPNVYPLIKNDTPKMLVYPEGCEPCLSEVKRNFRCFLVKDYVKSEKGTDFPKLTLNKSECGFFSVNFNVANCP